MKRTTKRTTLLTFFAAALVMTACDSTKEPAAPAAPLFNHSGDPRATFEAGNLNCRDLIPGSLELRVNLPQDGTFASTNGDGVSVTIDVKDSDQGQVFDWTMNGATTIGVAVKGGNNANFYDLRPNGKKSDTDYHAPVNHNNDQYFGLSHISFCYVFVPKLELEKSVDVGFAGTGDEVTYTLTFRNTGDGSATNVTINEPLPPGTAFVSCSDSCTQSADGSSVSWSLGTVVQGTVGSVTLTLRITTDQGCEICNVATIDSDETSPLPSNQVCITIIPRPNPAGASAHESAFGARVTDALLGLNETLVPVNSSQNGPGSNAQTAQLLDVNLPTDGAVLRADVMRTSSRSTVTESPAEATHTSIAEAANVNVLEGIVTASAVRGVATAKASGTSASFTTLGSAFKDLFIDADGSGPGAPVAFNNVHPGTIIDLSAAFGAGSFIKLYEEVGSHSEPTGNFGGTYAADVTVNMIQVHLTDRLPLVPGDQTVDIIVAQAVAHADFPQITLCAGRPAQAVSGHAFIASETTNPSAVPVLHGYVEIPSIGGEAHQDLEAVSTSVLTAQSAATDSRGTIDGQSARATSWAEIQGACLLANAGTCTVGASIVRSQSNSLADLSSASSTDEGTRLVQVTVLGVPVTESPPRNTLVELPGIGFVILNEQFCDNGAALPNCSDGSGHAGLTVRAVHLVVTVPSNPTGLQPGAEVILDEAHSDASFR